MSFKWLGVLVIYIGLAVGTMVLGARVMLWDARKSHAQVIWNGYRSDFVDPDTVEPVVTPKPKCTPMCCNTCCRGKVTYRGRAGYEVCELEVGDDEI